MPPSDRPPPTPGRTEDTLPQPTPLVGGPEIAEAVMAAIMEAHEHDNVGPEMDDIEREAARTPLEAIQEDGFREILDSMEQDVSHMERVVHVGLGLPNPGPNANGDIFTAEIRRQFAEMAHEHIQRELRSIPIPPAIRTTRPPVQPMPRVVGPEPAGIEPVFTTRVGRRAGMSVLSAVIAAVEATARQSTERVMRAIQQGQINAVSMGCSVPYEPRGVLGGEPAFQPASAMGPDEPSRNPIYFTARERLGVGVINPRGLAQLGLTGGGEMFEEHPEIFRTEHLGTFSDPHPAHISHPEDWAGQPRHIDPMRGERVTVPEFPIEANPRVQMGDIRSRRFDLIERTRVTPLPFEVDAWVMARGLIMQVEEANHETLLCRVWNPSIKRFERDILLTVEVSEAAKSPEPPARTAWDWLMEA